MPNLQTAPRFQNPLGLRFEHVRRQTEVLAKSLSAEDCQLQSMPDASPTKWHLAHLTWFFETFVLEKYEAVFKPFDASFRVLFNSYYNGIGDKHPRAQRGLISRPTLAVVMAYRQEVDERVLVVLREHSHDAELTQLITLGLHHEQQHQELLLTDIKHALSMNPARPAYAKRWPLTSVAPQPLTWHSYQGGLTKHGFMAVRDGNFAFDNETPRHHVYIAPFELASRLVTNGDYMAFMSDGGYQRPELWLALGWDWVRAVQHERPLYWQPKASSYENVTLQGMVDVDPNTPACHLSYFEADAFARWSSLNWSGARLPTEFEWEVATSQTNAPPNDNFVESAAYHPMPMQHTNSDGPSQLFGDA